MRPLLISSFISRDISRFISRSRRFSRLRAAEPLAKDPPLAAPACAAHCVRARRPLPLAAPACAADCVRARRPLPLAAI